LRSSTTGATVVTAALSEIGVVPSTADVTVAWIVCETASRSPSLTVTLNVKSAFWLVVVVVRKPMFWILNGWSLTSVEKA